MKRLVITVTCALFALPLTAQEAAPTAEATSEALALPAEIVFTSPVRNLMPEGIVWDAANEQFIVGSVLDGDLRRVVMQTDGTATLFPLIDDAEINVSVGLELDTVNNRLLVTNAAGDAFFGGPGAAGLAAYDWATGEKLWQVDLAALTDSPRNFANDVTVDSEGNAYVTNSFAPLIYKVTPEGEASVLVEDEQLTAPFLGGNGLVALPDGTLLVAVSGSQALLRVTTSMRGDVQVTPVDLDIPFSADGMILGDDGTLYAVARVMVDEEETQVIVAVTSNDDWASAAVGILTETTDAATTITLVGDIPYYINAYLNDFSRTEYEIVRVEIE